MAARLAARITASGYIEVACRPGVRHHTGVVAVAENPGRGPSAGAVVRSGLTVSHDYRGRGFPAAIAEVARGVVAADLAVAAAIITAIIIILKRFIILSF